jgi:chemotaxis protein MotB
MDGFRFARCGWMILLGLGMSLGLLTGCQTIGGDRDQLQAQNEELQKTLTAERNARMAAESQLTAAQRELMQHKTAPPAPAPGGGTGFSNIEGVETIAGTGKITVRIPGDVLFASGHAELKDSAKRTLDQIAAVIQKDYATNTIRVEGFTDTDPIRKSNWGDNLELSLARSAAVHRYLDAQGVDKACMYAAGWGEEKPRATKALSRRVEIVVVLNE